jgi:PAS domain S-box-containing protein
VQHIVSFSAWNRYGLAALAICASTLLTFALRPLLGDQTHYLTFTLAVIVCAWYGGLGPGLAATIGGFLTADYFFIEPIYSLLPIDAEDAALLGSVGVSVSLLTERLARAQARLAVATSAAGIGIFEWDAGKDRARWTPQFARLYGMDIEGQTGSLKDVLTHIHSEDAGRVERELRTGISQCNPEITQEFRVVSTAGETRWIEARSCAVRSKSDKRLRIVSAHIDVTERRLRELELEQARRALARSNEDLQRFAYATSHDLQQPLRTIGMYTELLVRRAAPVLDEESSRIAKTIVTGVDQMRELVAGVLNFCRTTAASETDGQADASVVLQRVLQHLRAAIEESGARITYGELPMVGMNEDQLFQVLLNLIGNAIKYRGSGTPEIRIAASRESGSWIFSVADNGIGIDLKDQERIFGFLQRLHGPSQYEGVGIGLALVRRVIERAGGRIWVESAPGKGSTFRFSVPVGRDFADDKKRSSAPLRQAN